MLKKACWLALFSYAHSILTRGYSCPLKPQQGIRKLIKLFIGGSRHVLFGSPAGRCGLTGLSHFLQFASHCFCRVRSGRSFLHSHSNANPRKSRHSVNRSISFSTIHYWWHLFFLPTSHAVASVFHYAAHSFTATHKSHQPFISLHSISLFQSFLHLPFPAHAQSKKSASPAEIGSRPPPSLSLRASCCQRPCSTRSRLAPVPYPKLPIFRYAA